MIDHYFINFNHDFEPGLSTVYVQVRTRDPFIVSISLMKISTFLADQIGASFWIGLIYGGIIAMLFYNIFLFFGIKERYYAFYVLYLCTFFMMNATYNGYTFMYFFSNYPNIQNWAQSISIFFFVFASLLFAQSFLNLKKYHFTPLCGNYLFYIFYSCYLTAFGSYWRVSLSCDLRHSLYYVDKYLYLRYCTGFLVKGQSFSQVLPSWCCQWSYRLFYNCIDGDVFYSVQLYDIQSD